MDDYCRSYSSTYNQVCAGSRLGLGDTEITKINTRSLCLQTIYSLWEKPTWKWLHMAMVYTKPGCASAEE